MSGRTPSFIVVGLVIIMFLLGMFYMSCSSKNNELRVSLEQFEERYRSVNDPMNMRMFLSVEILVNLEK